MVTSILYKSELEVASKLSQFGISTDDALKIVRIVATAHNDAVPNDPRTAAGQFRYIYGTRAIRDVWLPKGWEIDRDQGIEAIYDPVSGIKIVYQTVDAACFDSRSPQAISGKGSASRQLVERSTQGYLFPDMEAEDQAAENEALRRASATTWYFCVAVNDDEVTAELSLPYSVVDGNFSGFIERIYLVTDGGWAATGIIDLDDDGDMPDFEPLVKKK